MVSRQAAAMERDVAQPPSFRAFYDEHVRRVHAIALAMTSDAHAAEDVTQEAFARAYRDWDRVGRYDQPGAWVRKVAINLTRSRWRKLRNEAITRARLGPPADADPPDLPPEDAAVWAAVRDLPRRQAAAIALHYVEDLPVADVARILGVAEGTTKSDLHRARSRLAQLLQDREVSS